MPIRSIRAESSANLACAHRGGARATGLACNASMSARSGQDSRHTADEARHQRRADDPRSRECGYPAAAFAAAGTLPAGAVHDFDGARFLRGAVRALLALLARSLGKG